MERFVTKTTNPTEIELLDSKDFSLIFKEQELGNDQVEFILSLKKLYDKNLVAYKEDIVISLLATYGWYEEILELCSINELKNTPGKKVEDKLNKSAIGGKFKIYLHSKKGEKIKAESKSFKGKFGNAQKTSVSLVPVETMNQDSPVIWKMEMNEISGPTLKLNKDLIKVQEKIKSSQIWQALILPEVLRQGTRFFLEFKEDGGDVERDWVVTWEAFLRELGMEDPPQSKEDYEEYIDSVVNDWAEKYDYIDKVNIDIENEEAEY